MKDLADTATTELFPIKKARGRPATGKAKTAAERQEAYRIRKSDIDNKKNLNIWINSEAMIQLKMIARHYQIEPAALIKNLVLKENNKIIKALNTDEKWNKYFA